MTLGIAVFILGCLWFYFKEPGFRKAAHISAAVFGILILLGGLVAGAWYLKSQHDEKTRAAQEQARATQVQACIEHSTPAGNDTARDEIQEACERDPSKPLVLDMSKAVPLADQSAQRFVWVHSISGSDFCREDFRGHKNSIAFVGDGSDDRYPLPISKKECNRRNAGLVKDTGRDDGFVLSIRPTFPQSK